jgi:hypothetical protein
MIEKEVWLVITNTDTTEGRGWDKILYYCTSKSTAERLAIGKGVQGSMARVEARKAFLINKDWNCKIDLELPTKQDNEKDELYKKQQEVKEKALKLGLSEEEIKLLK